jgi:hypothetical protein
MEWQSDKFDFSDPDVRNDYVPEMGCTVGSTISMLRKSWAEYNPDGKVNY